MQNVGHIKKTENDNNINYSLTKWKLEWVSHMQSENQVSSKKLKLVWKGKWCQNVVTLRMLFGQCDDALEFVWEGGESFLLQLTNVQQLHTPQNCSVPVRECKNLNLSR